MPWFFYDSNGNQLTATRGTLDVTDGGTGAVSLTDGGVLLGSGTGAITAMAVLADGAMIVGDGTTDPVAETGATLRTSIGVGTTDHKYVIFTSPCRPQQRVTAPNGPANNFGTIVT